MTDTQNIQTIVHRVETLERQNRRIRLVGVLALAACVAAAIVGQVQPKPSPPRVIEAEQFILRDKDGKARGRLSFNEFFGANLYLTSGANTVMLWASESSSYLHLESGFTASLSASEESVEFKMNDNPDTTAQRRRLTELKAVPKWEDLIKTPRPPRVQLWADGSEASGLTLADKRGTSKVSLGTEADGMASVGISDMDGQIRGLLGVGADGRPSVELWDKDGERRAALGTTGLKVEKTGEERTLAESSLVLFDKDGRVIFKAP